MAQEEKQLLLQDLCARLPYGVKFGIGLGKLGKYDLVEINTKKGKVLFGHGLYTDLETCRPYLRPMSSMTEEEQFQLGRLLGATSYNLLKGEYSSLKELLEYFYKKHIDLFGLIPKGLALEAPEDMYK